MASLARNPWVALDVTTDPVAHARQLRRAHEHAVGDESLISPQVRGVVRESWRRSLAAGVLPEQLGAPVRLGLDELETARERSPLAPAVGVILSTLSSLDDDARHIVAIADAQANLLWVSGESGACERAREMRFQEGASWSEKAVGTNAVGTAAALDHALQIFSGEHLVAAVHPWTCSAAPIHDPASGGLIGVVDVTAGLRTNHPHTLSLAALAARAAEAALHLRSLMAASDLRERWEAAIAGRRTPSALVDAQGRVIASRGVTGLPGLLDLTGSASDVVALPGGRVAELQPLKGGGSILWLRRRSSAGPARLRMRFLGRDTSAERGGRRERGLRSLELLAVLAMHPEGLTAEQIALALYGEHGKAGTVRAQVHRVRTCVAGSALSTSPYRLTEPIDADWLEVRRLVSAGRPRDALGVYPGPLLPASDAPEIVETRALLEESLRRSILTTGDPELLSRWLDHPASADDLPAARALVAVLPCGDPRRAAATATAAAIARRLSPTST
jgi:hypothetical protein